MRALDNRRILVVEDDFFLASDLESAIEAVGAVVVGPFASANEAKWALDAGVDAAVLNVRVRDGLTYALAASLRQRGIPFVFATGQEMSGEPQEWHTIPWLTKPYNLDELVRLLSDAVDQH